MFSRHVLAGGRRRTIRRDEERDCAFVDVHGPRMLLLVVAIVALNLLDAYFTLLFLSHGGTELNPLVQVVLGGGEASTALSEALASRLGMECDIPDPLRSFEGNPMSKHQGQWAVAVGLALREVAG